VATMRMVDYVFRLKSDTCRPFSRAGLLLIPEPTTTTTCHRPFILRSKSSDCDNLQTLNLCFTM